MVLVTLHAALLLSAWALANRETVDLMRLKTYAASRETGRGHREAAARRLAMSHALALLETGVPESSPYEAGVVIDAGPEASDVMGFVLRFERLEGEPGPDDPALTSGATSRWTIVVQRDDPGAATRPRIWRFDPPAEEDDEE